MGFLRVFIFAALTLRTADAAVLRIVDLDRLAEESSAIVQGRIVAARVEWNHGHTAILTIYTVRAERYLKGFLGETFELTEPGGELDGLAMHVAGAPHFRVGEEAVLFVWTDDLYGRHQAIGFEQGVFRVRPEPGTGLKLLSRSAPLPTTQDRTAGRTARELNLFLAQVGEAVRRSRKAQP